MKAKVTPSKANAARLRMHTERKARDRWPAPDSREKERESPPEGGDKRFEWV